MKKGKINMSTVRINPEQEMSIYYVGKPQDPLDNFEAMPSDVPIAAATTVAASLTPAPAACLHPGTTTRPYEVSSRVFSTTQTAIVLTVLVTCIAGAILLLYSIDDRWKPDWKIVAFCDFDRLMKNGCPSESVNRVSAIIQQEADSRFRHFNGDTNYTALQLASSYFKRCRDLYLVNNGTYNQIISKTFSKNLTIVDVILLLSNQSPLFPVNMWQAVPCENSTCTLWKCEPAIAHTTLLSASSFAKRVAALNATLVEEHKKAINGVYQTLLDSLLAACTHSNDSTYELFEDDGRYAIASASFNALKPFHAHRSVVQWFIADMLIGLIRPRSVELALDYFSGIYDGGEIECLDSTKRIFGNITHLPYVDEQMERFAEAMQQVLSGKHLMKFFGSQHGNMSRLVLGLSDMRLAEIEQLNVSSLRPLKANVTFAEFASYEQLLDSIYRGNRRLKTAIVETQSTDNGKLVVPLILAKLLDVADTPVKDSLAQLLLRNSEQGVGTLDDDWLLPDGAL
ncbi:hypothetical protein BIW11_00349 [Tropilaelaps mercedesae]|uniref:Uncharacterized protein n=1 Tax=Tropilaelaps mercedesae TaxID=418985 RepID=A0A1V9XXI1_9ACAR|nr:hypothetical protein BIW11_00349 [Tropilaelaps mercedesae]